jgi:hypothetical protein
MDKVLYRIIIRAVFQSLNLLLRPEDEKTKRCCYTSWLISRSGLGFISPQSTDTGRSPRKEHISKHLSEALEGGVALGGSLFREGFFTGAFHVNFLKSERQEGNMRTTARFTFMALMLLGILFQHPLAVWAEVDGYLDRLPAWTHVGSACAVDEGSLDKFNFASATLSFKSFKSGTVVARCNVLNPLDVGNPDWNGLIVDYRDPDGKGTAYRVRALLKSLLRSTGSTSTIATFDSNAFATTTRVEHLKTFTHTFDFLKYEYYVEIWIDRATTTGSVSLNAVRLARVDFIPT